MPNVSRYHRPERVEEALRLLNRAGVPTVALAGGTSLVPQLHGPEPTEVVDLQALPLATLALADETLRLGAMVRLQAVAEADGAPALLRDMARRAGPNTLRHAATVGGLVASAPTHSELLAALLLFGAEVELATLTGPHTLPLAELLRAPETLRGALIVRLSCATTGETAHARVARTPADEPIVAALARRREAGTLVALCGVAETPILVEPAALPEGIAPPSDFRGSAEYRKAMAAVLTRRVLAELDG